jgi:hypothetical protein
MARALNGMAMNTAAAANLSTFRASKLGPIRRHGKLHEIAAKFFHSAAAARRMLHPGHFLRSDSTTQQFNKLAARLGFQPNGDVL